MSDSFAVIVSIFDMTGSFMFAFQRFLRHIHLSTSQSFVWNCLPFLRLLHLRLKMEQSETPQNKNE